jgi:hypothetical protein
MTTYVCVPQKKKTNTIESEKTKLLYAGQESIEEEEEEEENKQEEEENKINKKKKKINKKKKTTTLLRILTTLLLQHSTNVVLRLLLCVRIIHLLSTPYREDRWPHQSNVCECVRDRGQRTQSVIAFDHSIIQAYFLQK